MREVRQVLFMFEVGLKGYTTHLSPAAVCTKQAFIGLDPDRSGCVDTVRGYTFLRWLLCV